MIPLSFLWRFRKPIGVGLAVLVAVLALWGLYEKGYSAGDAYRDAIWKDKIRAEQLAQAKAINEANENALSEIIRLNAAAMDQATLIDTLRQQAEADPLAGRPALGASSLQRINRGREGKPE
jgi:hypothetical protein